MTDMTDGRDLLRIDADGSVLTLAGEIDASNSERLRTAIVGLPAGDRTIDTGAVTFIDCAGLTALISAATDTREAGGRLLLRNPGRPVDRIVGLTETGELLLIER